MAKQSSFIKIEGEIGGLSFYKGADGVHYVRAKGGVSSSRIKNDPAFRRTRENGTEFGNVAHSGKLFRRAIQNLAFDVIDRTRTARMVKALSQVKNADQTSNRGERTVHIGIQTSEGKDAFSGFDFNQRAMLDHTLRIGYELDTVNGELSIPELNVERHVACPQGTTHMAIQAAQLRFDFQTGIGNLQLSNIEEHPVTNADVPIELTWANPLPIPGVDYYFLKVSFFQKINGKLYTLHNGTYNTLRLIAIE